MKLALLASMPCLCAVETAAQSDPSVREKMYRRYLEFPSYVNGGKVEPHWMADGSSFWCEDQAFLVKVYLRARVFVSDECLDRYRLHEGLLLRRCRAGRGV